LFLKKIAHNTISGLFLFTFLAHLAAMDTGPPDPSRGRNITITGQKHHDHGAETSRIISRCL